MLSSLYPYSSIYHAHADQCLPMLVREATAAEIAACHDPQQMARVVSKTAVAAADAMAGGPGRAHFSSDTYVNQHTLLCARLAAGACADVATAVVRCTCTFHCDHAGPTCASSNLSAFVASSGWPKLTFLMLSMLTCSLTHHCPR